MIDLIIPNYNSENTIEQTLASLLAQTTQRKFLVTIVDDCSTDSSLEIIEKFKNFLPLRVLKMPQHSGAPGEVRQYGVDRTNCPYVMFLDSDDVLMPTAAERISRIILQKQPNYLVTQILQQTSKDGLSTIDITNITWLHGKCYKRSVIDKFNIRFDNLMNEDGSYNLLFFWLNQNIKNAIYYLEEPTYIWKNNKKSITRKCEKNHFIADIAKDYITTYNNAIKKIVESVDESVKENKGFVDTCAGKFSEFLNLYDSFSFLHEDRQDEIKLVKKAIIDYVSFINEIGMLNREFIRLANLKYNEGIFYNDYPRLKTFLQYLKEFGIDYEGVFDVYK